MYIYLDGKCSAPYVKHQPRALLQQLDLRSALDLRRAALRLAEDLRQHLLDLLAHALRLAADIHVALPGEYRVRNVLAVFPQQVLHVDLAPVRLVVLARERAVQLELALELRLVLRPLVLVQEVLVFMPAAVEQ